ncbi:hypothetical protein KKH36_03600 [Patescibacteria group bacterium]|nr:hypothetical protein [Patescibacteria group bacterium]
MNRNPYQVFFETFKNEIDILMIFIHKEEIGIGLNMSIAKITGTGELFHNLFEEGCIPEKSFKNIKKAIAIEIQKLIDICPENKKYSKDLYHNLQTLMNSWIKGDIGKWKFEVMLDK